MNLPPCAFLTSSPCLLFLPAILEGTATPFSGHLRVYGISWVHLMNMEQTITEQIAEIRIESFIFPVPGRMRYFM